MFPSIFKTFPIPQNIVSKNSTLNLKKSKYLATISNPFKKLVYSDEKRISFYKKGGRR